MQYDEENRDNFEPRKMIKTSRVVIYPKDIQVLTGKSYRHALYLNQEIRNYFCKKKHQFPTIYEFADYTGISPEIISSHIK